MPQTTLRTGDLSGTNFKPILLSPVEWAFFAFPIPEEGCSTVSTEWLIGSLLEILDLVTEADTTLLQRVLHVAHILVTLQGVDRLWPDVIDLLNGCGVGESRSLEPTKLFVILKELLATTEFDLVLHSAQMVSTRVG